MSLVVMVIEIKTKLMQGFTDNWNSAVRANVLVKVGKHISTRAQCRIPWFVYLFLLEFQYLRNFGERQSCMADDYSSVLNELPIEHYRVHNFRFD